MAKKVLVIEDDPMLCRLMRAFLEDDGYIVYEALDGISGLEMHKKERADVIITDLRMPKMDGLTVVKNLREWDNEVAVLVVSGTGDNEAIEEALGAGADGFLHKPIIKMQELQAIVERILREKGNTN